MGFDIIDTLLTAVSMSIDAMTVNATNGLIEKDMKIRKMLLISLSFGIFQFVMPCIGYSIGMTFKQYVEVAIPWIGFGLLLILAIKSFIDWLKEYLERKKHPENKIEEKKITFGNVMVQSLATSIDALCIGFVYMALSIGDALIVFGIIGVITFALSFLTVFFAQKLAGKLEKRAGLIAAIVFVGVAIKILLEGIL